MQDNLLEMIKKQTAFFSFHPNLLPQPCAKHLEPDTENRFLPCAMLSASAGGDKRRRYFAKTTRL